MAMDMMANDSTNPSSERNGLGCLPREPPPTRLRHCMGKGGT